MIRALAIGVGLLEAVFPRRLIDAGERLAFDTPETGRLQPWTVPMARLEGLVFVWLLARKGGGLDALRAPLGVVGVAMALSPRAVVAFALEVAYENPDDLECKPWVVPATRLLGAVYVVAGLFAGRGATPKDEPRTAQPPPEQ
ncbi:hypothetical protein [Natronorubrum sulfidifaciens]|uniref:Uncharacterized protein n=1 Tax=Natronorubrum sulfidifaciens JCM 14089 TaxID=1230460 RepID=L9W9W9_9EURY|nr:hypothetical protein [Natronorubrum sulfidifaciens]ELY46046.1 hypothetical protein C495_07375 [Natronorubrum sulfidifaciens JCM 14089]